MRIENSTRDVDSSSDTRCATGRAVATPTATPASSSVAIQARIVLPRQGHQNAESFAIPGSNDDPIGTVSTAMPAGGMPR